jgi:NIPSNAP
MTIGIVELRQYLLRPGQRENLIELFDREFIEAQEALGMSILGQFRDGDRPDYFVWLRGFADMASRHAALTSFYGGPLWAQHGAAANATMIDSDNVLLLRPVTPADALPHHDPTSRARRIPTGTVVALVEHHDENDRTAIARFRFELIPALAQSGAATIGLYATEHSENTFTPLPVRPDDVIVWFGAIPVDHSTLDWTELQRIAARGGHSHYEIYRLTPTSRSALDGTAKALHE